MLIAILLWLVLSKELSQRGFTYHLRHPRHAVIENINKIEVWDLSGFEMEC